MGALDRLRRRVPDEVAVAVALRDNADRQDEESLRARLTDDPNDGEAFDLLARIVWAHAVDGHEGGDPQREADDAVWALAEEIARSQRAWYPLIELARLSIDDDREVALRRLATAAERDPSGYALTQGVAMLRQAGHPEDALNLGVGHWRPREHVIDVGRELVEAALEAGRTGEARRHLEALEAHADRDGVSRLRSELERLLGPRPVAGHVRGDGPGTPLVPGRTSRLLGLFRR